ncbi:unnamed protein product [Didymodactylos carnosus]|uniref:Uncharacterized protein n=1 Tax=Didymodactylos carnosus TaxID=1234261 RepID=A0A814DVS8_9BILA|nr:unnamed protein product [Didymodactylos carnosus]CAF1310913.1 unnamed protein product [Didymodactylos carnosus]CAF3734448.1 unnamed protein product [Didymodactylos carnosus]CAF4118800.1 unnamed protein product [Didymodactylos carnosus]
MLKQDGKLIQEKSITRIQTMMKLQDGTERAVDWIDVYAIWILILIILKQLIEHCHHRRVLSTEKSNKTS